MQLLKAVVTDLTSLSVARQVYLAGLMTIGLAATLALGESVLGVATTLTGVMCVVLAAERKISNFVWAFINAGLYGYISYTQKFYGDMALNWGVYLPFQFIGYYLWRTNIAADGVADVRSLTKQGLWWCAIGGVVSMVALAKALQVVGGHAPITDAANVTLSLLATWLLANRYAEQWLCWIAVNVSGVWLWLHASGDHSMAGLVMWALFLVNSVYGYWRWSRNGHTAVQDK
jgi:nicotinamide mononucleotide transporter